MKPEMKEALAAYGRTIKADGWKAGEKLIDRREKEYPEFRKWAYALGIMLRAGEILEQGEGSCKKVAKAR